MFDQYLLELGILELLEKVLNHVGGGKKKKFVRQVVTDIQRFLEYKRKMIKIWLFKPIQISNILNLLLFNSSLQNSKRKIDNNSKTNNHNKQILQILITFIPLSSDNPSLFHFYFPPSLNIQSTTLILMFQSWFLFIFIHPAFKFILSLSLWVILITTFLHIIIYDMKNRFFVVYCKKAIEMPKMYKRYAYALKRAELIPSY